MNLIQATEQDFQRITQFYRDVIAHTGHMDTYARWVYGKHPTDEMIRGYIRNGAMYCCEKDGSILSSVAVTQQGEDYHGAAWAFPLRDDGVSVVHLLCVAPEWQGKGIARMTMQQIMVLSREMGKKRCGWMHWLATRPHIGFMNPLAFRNRISGGGMRIMWAGLIFSYTR